MNIKNVYAVYFSPTGTTKFVVNSMLSEFDINQKNIDLTPFETKDCQYSFGADELVIIGTPVCGGRVPSAAEKRIRLLKGNNTPVVLVLTYGSIHYDNALFELQQLINPNGFITIAAAAIVSEHNVINKIGAGRPDEHDMSTAPCDDGN